jgi:hypothetical protein
MGGNIHKSADELKMMVIEQISIHRMMDTWAIVDRRGVGRAMHSG